MDDLQICIVGGSITGCTAAIAALRGGMHPQVFEKSSGNLTDRGAGLGIPSAIAVALRDQAFIADGFPHISIRSLAHSSRADGAQPLGGIAGDVPTFLEAIRWGHLFDQLRSLVPDERYHAGIAVTDAQNEADSVRVSFDNGHSEHYDLVIFADGYRSLGREIVAPAQQPEYQGYFIWRGTLPEQLIDNVAIFEQSLQRVGFAGGHFFAYLLPGVAGSTALGARELNWGLFLPVAAQDLDEYLLDREGVQHKLSVPPGLMRVDLERRLKESAKKLLPAYYAGLVERTRHTFGQGIVATIPTAYRQGRICLAGDAGAVVPPFTTSGVFKGMKNAVELLGVLTQAPDLDGALDAWEQAQLRAGDGLKKLSDVMEEKLIRDIPDFTKMTQQDLTQWWASIQTTLEEVMG